MSKIDSSDLLEGVSINVYQAKSNVNKPGAWHAHVCLPDHWDNYFEGCEVASRALRNGGYGYWWTDAGYCDSEDEARSRACAIVGHVFGRRLAEKIGPRTVPATVIPAERKLRL